MLNGIFEFSLRNRFLILVFVGLIIGLGMHSMFKLPIDAVPDVTPNQVQILTNAPGLGPIEVEKFITFPVETAMSGLPGIELIRSVSRFGLSAVTIYFDEDMDIYFCRRLIMERLPQAREAIPEGLGSPEMGPISTGLGEIYQFEVKGEDHSLMDLRAILDWDIAFQLRSVPGVIEVNTYGGEVKTYEIQLDASKLVSYDLDIGKIFTAIEQNNANAGGAYIEHAQEQYLIRGEGLIQTLQDIENIVVATRNDGTPIYIRNLGKVQFAPMVRQGAVTRDGRGEVVTGIVMLLVGENGRVVVNRVKDRLEQIQKSLPEGVTIDAYYDRTDLVRKTIDTVTEQSYRGDDPRCGRFIATFGEFSWRTHSSNCDSIIHVGSIHRNVIGRDLRKPDEFGGDRFWSHCQWCGCHDRKHHSAYQSAPGKNAELCSVNDRGDE